jgi:hypothetical protein
VLEAGCLNIHPVYTGNQIQERVFPTAVGFRGEMLSCVLVRESDAGSGYDRTR